MGLANQSKRSLPIWGGVGGGRIVAKEKWIIRYPKLTRIPFLFSDGVPTVLAAEWETSTVMFDGESARGPVPRLFATNPAEAKDNLASDPARAHKDLQRIMSRITINENIPAHAAFELVLNPR
jgi:hypothetical protein